MLENNEAIAVSFSYTDEFGQLISSEKTFTSDSIEDGVTLPFLLDQFKLFLLGAGFSPQSVSKIEYNEE